MLTADDIVVLRELTDGEWVYPACDVARDTGLTITKVRASMARLREAGLATQGPLFNHDENRVAGRGTWANRVGLRMQDALREPQP